MIIISKYLNVLMVEITINISNGGCDSSITLVACDEEFIRADLQNDLSNFNSLITRNAGYNALACIERQDGGKEYITYSPLSCSSGKLNLKMTVSLLVQTKI